jgi:hypothetical protein
MEPYAMDYEYTYLEKSIHANAPAVQQPIQQELSSGEFHYGGVWAGGLSAAGLALVIGAAVLYKKKRSARSAQRIATADSAFTSLPTPV